MNLSLRDLRPCFEGAVPASIATCAADGTPNVTKLSHVHFVDDRHVALSYQFFNKTRQNVLGTGRATVELLDPLSAAHYHLHLEYLRTETEGSLFETMRARLAAIASHTGMSKVFRLLGSDLYRVLSIETVGDDPPLPDGPPADLLGSLRSFSAELLACTELAPLLDTALEGLERHWTSVTPSLPCSTAPAGASHRGKPRLPRVRGRLRGAHRKGDPRHRRP